jgi:predicted nuclease of predicted toxin-antitoxin system
VRFKLDENLPLELLADFRAAGHEADGLRDEGLSGAPDDVVLDLVRRENRVLLTLDKNYAARHGHVIVSKDGEFHHEASCLATLPRSSGSDGGTAQPGTSRRYSATAFRTS